LASRLSRAMCITAVIAGRWRCGHSGFPTRSTSRGNTPVSAMTWSQSSLSIARVDTACTTISVNGSFGPRAIRRIRGGIPPALANATLFGTWSAHILFAVVAACFTNVGAAENASRARTSGAPASRSAASASKLPFVSQNVSRAVGWSARRARTCAAR